MLIMERSFSHFAQMLVRDHNQALDKIKQLRADRGVKDTGDAKLTPEDQCTYGKLSKLSGADFDREARNRKLRIKSTLART
jgi:predicted outer membrane protein